MSRSSHSLSYPSPVLGQERPSRRLSLSPCSSDFLLGLTSSIQGNPPGFPEKLNAKQQVRGPVGLFDFAIQKQKSYKNPVQIFKGSRAIFPIRSMVPQALADLFADTEKSVLPSWRDVVRYGPDPYLTHYASALCPRAVMPKTALPALPLRGSRGRWVGALESIILELVVCFCGTRLTPFSWPGPWMLACCDAQASAQFGSAAVP
jgi:hypothetical protein